MPKSYEKYLAKLPKHLRLQLAETTEKVKCLQLKNLDIKKLHGYNDIFRCRVGKFRIIFMKTKNGGDIIEINTRGDVY